MYNRAFLAILLLFCSTFSVAQYVCTVVSICEETGTLSDSTILSVNYYNQKNQLIRQTNNVTMDEYQEPYYSVYTYNSADLLKTEVDSNRYRKVIKTYSYKERKIVKVEEIIFSLSTENFSRQTGLDIEDRLRGNTQPDIRYVWIVDTLIHSYQYNSKGLLLSISKKRKDDLYERSEIFNYDEKNRLVRSFDSDRFLYKYYYDGFSRVVKKEKYTNRYIDDSGIGPDLKPESLRLEKAVWDLSDTYKMAYDAAGKLIQYIEYTRSEGVASLTENHFYDQEGRIIQTTSSRAFADAYFPLCMTLYRYE
jgi:YD repeat-containing protein